jgi:isoleucyl-tRNA synthetase
MSELSTVDLKKTVNLPSKDLPMKGNLAQTEPARLKRWAESDVYAATPRKAEVPAA